MFVSDAAAIYLQAGDAGGVGQPKPATSAASVRLPPCGVDADVTGTHYCLLRYNIPKGKCTGARVPTAQRRTLINRVVAEIALSSIGPKNKALTLQCRYKQTHWNVCLMQGDR